MCSNPGRLCDAAHLRETRMNERVANVIESKYRRLAGNLRHKIGKLFHLNPLL